MVLLGGQVVAGQHVEVGGVYGGRVGPARPDLHGVIFPGESQVQVRTLQRIQEFCIGVMNTHKARRSRFLSQPLTC